MLTTDIVNSRKISDFRKKRDQKLKPISKLHLQQKLIISDYAVTAWDEFEVILTHVVHIPQIIIDLRRFFFPMQLWIAVGIGHVSEPYKVPVNVFSGGEAFERARTASEFLKKETARFRRLTQFSSKTHDFDQTANTIYLLQDTLLRSTSSRQWQTINAYIATGSQELTAQKMKLDQSTVSRNLRRAYYWQIEETQKTIRGLLERHFGSLK